jgi:DNA-binding transcriptional ArsR family regulator
MPNYQNDLNAIFNALADPTRRQVLERLCHGPATVSELALPFDMALPSFTQHLGVLENAGLVRSEKKGRSRIYQIEPAQVEQAGQWLEQQRHIWEQRLGQLDNYLIKLKEQDK